MSAIRSLGNPSAAKPKRKIFKKHRAPKIKNLRIQPEILGAGGPRSAREKTHESLTGRGA